MREIQGDVSGKGSIEALISPFRPPAQCQRARPSFSELRQMVAPVPRSRFPPSKKTIVPLLLWRHAWSGTALPCGCQTPAPAPVTMR